MSSISPTATSPSSNFQLIFDAALEAYEKETKDGLRSHRLFIRLQDCHSPDAILSLLKEQFQGSNRSPIGNERLTHRLNVTVKILHAFSVTLGEGTGLLISPARAVFTGIGILLIAAKDVNASQETLIDLFERIKTFLIRLETYTAITLSDAMMGIVVKIMIEVLSIMAIATKELKQGWATKYLKKLVGEREIEDALKRLDQWTLEEAWMGYAQILKTTHNVNEKLNKIDDKVNEAIANRWESEQMERETLIVAQQMTNSVVQIQRNQLRDNLRRWLSPPDPSTNHNIARSVQQKGTTTWFMEGSIFGNWKSTASLLWIHGKPGSGKSVLCSAIIHDIMTLREAGRASLGYFYCDFRDSEKQNRYHLLGSLLTQLSSRSDPFCDVISGLYSAHDDGAHKPNDINLTKCLRDILSLPNPGPVYIVIDALDECPNVSGIPSAREQVLELVRELADLQLPNLHICVTSRPEVDIRSVLEPLAPLLVSLHDQNGQKEDIIEYIRAIVDSDPRMQKWRKEEKNLVVETLSGRADGMFRWVYCQLETLRHCLPSSVRPMLDKLPETLDETYERILRDIKRANRDHALHLLQCLTVAIRPLRVEELAEVLAVDFDVLEGGNPKLNLSWRWEDQEQAVLSVCSSLIAIVNDNGSQFVQFSHFSVKEFLTSERLAQTGNDLSRYHIYLEPAHTILAQSCLATLLRLGDHADKKDGKSLPLAQYAAEHWVTHARFLDVSSRIQKGLQCLFDPDKPHFAAWVNVHDIDGDSFGLSSYGFPPSLREAAPLYYAALCGFHGLAKHLLVKYPTHINVMGGNQGAALHAASLRNHAEVVQLLLEDGGGNVDVRDPEGWTPLHTASQYGHRDIVRLLLKHRADVNVKRDDHATPLHLATIDGHVEVVETLLEHNASVNARDSGSRAPLHRASENGYASVARLLLKHGADVNVWDTDGLTPLHLACYRGKLKVVGLLLEKGANVDAEDNNHKTPIQMASGGGHSRIGKLLSECGAESRV